MGVIMARLPNLPKALKSKIYKTGQTRGADDDQIFQNRVGRNSNVLIPLNIWQNFSKLQEKKFENDFIILISPRDFFVELKTNISTSGLVLGENALIFYEQRVDWNDFNPSKYNFIPATARSKPLGGHYVARIANTTSEIDKRINEGYTSSGMKGAGIRLYEYCDIKGLEETRLQLEAIFWHAVDANEKMLDAGMQQSDIDLRKTTKLKSAETKGLLNYNKLIDARILNKQKELVCPLCLQPFSAAGMLSRLAQPTGRERHDLTVTEINLFHIKELAYGEFNHRIYNLGWGHHHCNVVCKDSGIEQTLDWMKDVMKRNNISI